MAKIVNNKLSLIGYKMSDGLSRAFGKTLRYCQDNSIKEVYLEQNGLKDENFAHILQSINLQKHLKVLCYSKNEFG